MSNTIQYSSEKLEKFKSIINAELKIASDELTTLKEDRKNQKQRLANTNTDFNQSSKHFQQQAKNKDLINRLEQKTIELEEALIRIDNKSFGVCIKTGELIREERLVAIPTARFDI